MIKWTTKPPTIPNNSFTELSLQIAKTEETLPHPCTTMTDPHPNIKIFIAGYVFRAPRTFIFHQRIKMKKKQKKEKNRTSHFFEVEPAWKFHTPATTSKNEPAIPRLPYNPHHCEGHCEFSHDLTRQACQPGLCSQKLVVPCEMPTPNDPLQV